MRDDVDEEEEVARCAHPTCPQPLVSIDMLHPSGYCFACCPLAGPLDCEDCWPDDDEDE